MSTIPRPAKMLVVTAREIKAATLLQILLGIGALGIAVFRLRPGPATSLVPAFAVSEIITAYLLIGDGVRKRCPATLMLAGAFISTVVAYDGAPAALGLLGFSSHTAVTAGALVANFLFPAWVLAYAFMENYCLTRQFSKVQFAARSAGVLAVSVIAPFVLAGAAVALASREVLNSGGWMGVALAFGTVTLVIFTRRSAPTLTNLALRVSLQCLLIDLLLVAISPVDSLGYFGAECFALIACTAIPFVYIFEFNGMYAQLATQTNVFRDQALRDALTGVGNRRGYESMIASRLAALRRGEAGDIGLLVVDVDNFKAYNDAFGHDAGDRCLQRIAKAIELGVARSDDSVFRYGGEEFAVVLPLTETSGLEFVAERIRNTVWALAISNPGTAFGRVTVSIGIAVAPAHGTTPAELFVQADRALYRAKSSGRNCTTMQHVS